MIEGKELRIGNIVHGALIEKRKEVVIDSITGSGVNIEWAHEMTCEDWEFSQLYGIPLTEEWLIKRMGFEAEKDSPFFEKVLPIGIGRLHINPNNGTIWVRKNGHILNPSDIHFVHQVQNIYFALSGLELTIKTDI